MFQYLLKQILTSNELNEYLYESLLDIVNIENRITNETVKELRSEGLLN